MRCPQKKKRLKKKDLGNLIFYLFASLVILVCFLVTCTSFHMGCIILSFVQYPYRMIFLLTDLYELFILLTP